MESSQEVLMRKGFLVLSVEDGMATAVEASKTCSGSRSDCCTRVCSRDEAFVHSTEEWDRFLSIEGGQVQF